MARRIVIVLALVGTLGISANAAPAGPDRPTHPAAQAALRYFESVEDADFDALLRRLRRPAPSVTLRATVIGNLPEEGELVPTAQESAKLKVLLPVLAFHGREHDLELRVITVGGLAVAGLHARTVVLISREAVDILDHDELLAILAHELGHDYVWDEYEEARRQGDYGRLQELELVCDGLALIAMDRLGVDPRHLASAATKLARYNERLKGSPVDRRYVPLDQRVRFIRSMARLVAR
jgi:peptidase M48-like protein